MRVGRSSRVGRDAGDAVTCGASVSSSMVGYCDGGGGAAARRAARPRAGAAGAARGGPRPGRELLVVVDVGHVDERAHRGGVVVQALVADRRSRPRPSRRPRSGSGAGCPRPPRPLRRRGSSRDHRHLSGRRLGPVRQRHRTRRLAGVGPAAGVGAGRGAVRGLARGAGRRAAGTGPRAARRRAARRGDGARRLLGRRPLGAALDRRLGLFRAEDPHALGGRRLGSVVFEVGHTILRKSRSTRLDPPPSPASAPLRHSLSRLEAQI